MKIEKVVVECAEKNFSCMKFEFNSKFNVEDKKLFDSFIKEGKKLADFVNPVLARDASQKRSYKKVLQNCIAGIIAEYCWRYWLKSEARRLALDISVSSLLFESVDKHVDISISYPNGTSKTVEVRSSFPYTRLENAICRVFDIIGWYVNPVKTEEIRKDYYVRVLYPFDVGEFNDKIGSESFPLYLTGGATRKLLEESPYAKDKTFTPYDDVNAALSSKLGEYRVIEPIVNAYDTLEITRLILKMS